MHTALSPYVLEKSASLLKSSASSDYRLSIRANVRGLWSGAIDGFSFVDSMVDTIRRGFTNAWAEGMSAVGVNISEITPEEQGTLDRETYGELSHIYSFMLAIQQGSKANGGKLTPLLARAEMWTNRYVTVKSIAMTMAGLDKKLMWMMNPIKEHCTTCLRLHGRVYRASTWKKYDIYPRHRSLACGGWRCGCTLVTTSSPATPGRPPSIP